MDKALSCIERIRIVRGVNRGIITNEQLQHLFLLYGMSEKEKISVLEALEKKNIIPVSEDEIIERSQAPKEEKEKVRAVREVREINDIGARLMFHSARRFRTRRRTTFSNDK